MALALILQKGADVAGLLRAEQEIFRQFLGADAAQLVAAAVNDRVTERAVALLGGRTEPRIELGKDRLSFNFSNFVPAQNCVHAIVDPA